MTIRGFRQPPVADADGGAPAVTLDPSQRAVVELPVGVSAAVIGAPGSGRTTTLRELVAERILAQGLDPAEVLVLAPSRAAATRLRDELALRVGVPTLGPLARTATSVAFEVLARRAAETGTEPPRLLTGAEQDQIIADLLAGHEERGTGPAWPDPLGVEVRRLRAFRTELRELLMRATEEGVRPDALAEAGRAHGVPEWIAAAEFAREYEDVVDSFRGDHLDSAELLAEAVLLVSRGDALTGIRLVVADDLHEATVATLSLLRALAARGADVVAFGDPDVAAATFRGAEASALGRLSTVLGLPGLRTLVLDRVHRQPPALRALTSAVTARIGAAGAGRQRQAGSAPGLVDDADPIQVIEAPTRALELARLARRLREEHLLGGVPWARMVVLVRSGSLVPQVARSLATAEVPTRTAVAGRALRDDLAALALIRAVDMVLGRVPLTPDIAAELATGPLGGLDGVQLRRLRLAMRQEELAGDGHRSSDELLVEALAAPGRLETLDLAPARRLARLARTLQGARELAASDGTIEELLWHLWEGSKLATPWFEQALQTGIVADQANRDLDGVVALFTAARRFVERNPGRPASDFVEELLGAEVPEDTLSPQPLADTVLVATPSAVVGAGYEVVAVAALQEGVWPNLRLRGSLLHPQRLSAVARGLDRADVDERAEVLGDELRMLALAVSRASRVVVLSATANDEEAPSPFLRLVPPAPGRAEAEAGAEAGRVATDAPAALRIRPDHPLSLRGLVGALRRELAIVHRDAVLLDDGRVVSGDRTARRPADATRERGLAAASALARLAAEGVTGADPAEWYGLREPSTTEPVVDLTDPDARVPVSPSRLEAFERSPLNWFIDQASGGSTSTAMGIGTIVHAVMEEASLDPDADLRPPALEARLDERWGELPFESPWVGERERRQAGELIAGVSGYLRDFEARGGRMLAAEGGFELEVGVARLRGKIDRIELTEEGRVVIVDLKTGRHFPTRAEIPAHAQLGSYQLAFVEGSLEQVPAGTPSGGAKLLYVSGGTRGLPYRELPQEPLTREELDGFRARIADAATGMAGATFEGTPDLGERDPGSARRYRIHLVRAVSA